MFKLLGGFDIFTYKNQSTAYMSEILPAGMFKADSTIIMVTRPADGIPAAPMDASVAVILVTTKSMKESLMSLICAMKMDATASYNAVPSKLTVAPTGSTNREITLGILFFCSIHLNVMGSVAALDAVANATISASIMFLPNMRTFLRVNTR